METHAKVVIIGGGVVGVSTLYHLAKKGWSDVVLVERKELTSGSTWHAAGLLPLFNMSYSVGQIHKYSVKFYQELQEETGMDVGFRNVSNIRLACNQDRMDEFRQYAGVASTIGVQVDFLTPEQVLDYWPMANIDGLVGAIRHPQDGYIRPADLTQALARGARDRGAEIYRNTAVAAITRSDDGLWLVTTDKGDITCEHVVSATGNFARKTGEMVGLNIPVIPVEHQYIVTEDVAQIAAMIDAGSEHPHVMDPAGESYLRQEGRGLCIGFYEQPCRPWAVNGTPWDFGHELLADDFDKIEDSIAFAYKRFPALESAGVKSVIHGPFTFAPDGNPLVGPVPGMRNYWSACAVMAGFSQGGGVGLTLAQWMVEGEPERDVFAMDCARFGAWITPGYTVPKVIENYQRRFSVSYPNEELPAARSLRRTPMYDHFSSMGAVWGAQFGLEVPNYFAQTGEPDFETPSFRRSNAWDAVRREVKAVRSGVGINEVHNFSKFLVSGTGARAWLDRIMAGRIPQVGRLSLTPMLSPKGKLIGDFTVSCIREGLFQLTASYGSQAYHQRWFEENMAPGVTLQNISDQRTGFQIAGPKAAEVLQSCTTVNVAEIKFLDVIEIMVGSTACLVQQVSYTGDHGFELYCDPMAQRTLWDRLWEAGKPHGMTPFGMRAMMSLRLDRFFGSWLSEFSPDYTAAETGLDRFISFRKPVDFIGRSAAEAERLTPPERQLVIFEVDALDADIVAYEPVFINGTVQGFCTSGGYSHHAEKSIAFALVPRAAVTDDLQAEIEILGQLRPAKRLLEPLL